MDRMWLAGCLWIAEYASCHMFSLGNPFPGAFSQHCAGMACIYDGESSLEKNTHHEHPFEKNHTSKQATQYSLQTVKCLFGSLKISQTFSSN